MVADDGGAERWPPRPPEPDPPEVGADAALARAAAHLNGGDASWDEASRFGAAGLAARRALRRALRPYASRQQEVDATLVGAVREVAESVRAHADALAWHAAAGRAVALATPLDPDTVVEAQTLLGPLWLSASDNLISTGIREHGLHEPHVTALLARGLVRSGATFVDIGANIGWFSVLASRLVGARGTVIAVEPGPNNLPVLRANLWRHGCDNTAVLPLAAYSHTGQVEMVLNPEGGAGNWIGPGVSGAAFVPCARLDDLLGGRPVDVLKIDAEGSDDHAIRGLEETIARSPGITIVCEWWTSAYGGHGSRPPDVLAYYQSLGLGLSLLTDTGEERAISPHALVGMAGTVPFVNLVMRRA